MTPDVTLAMTRRVTLGAAFPSAGSYSGDACAAHRGGHVRGDIGVVERVALPLAVTLVVTLGVTGVTHGVTLGVTGVTPGVTGVTLAVIGVTVGVIGDVTLRVIRVDRRG